MTFPIVLSNPPPPGRKAPSGRDGLAEVAAAGITHVRSGIADWSAELASGQIALERQLLDAAHAHGLAGWVWLGALPNLPPQAGSPREQLLVEVVNALKGHPGLGAWKGIDEPAWAKVPAAGLVRAHDRIEQLDPAHPVVVVQAPRGTLAQLRPYRPAFDIAGVDIYPVSYPPGAHAGPDAAADLGVVGDVTRTLAQAAGGKPVWTTLQIAWSGVLPPDHVPRFPTLREERFMAYQAIAAGARGLVFFGGHLTRVMRPADAKLGWNWTFWTEVLRPLVEELSSSAVAPALTAPPAQTAVRSSAKDVEVATRRAGGFLYVIAVRRGGATSRVAFTGLPAGIEGGQVLFEYANGQFRSVAAAGGAFRDWLGPYDARVYRFRA